MKEIDTSVPVVHERDNAKPFDSNPFRDLQLGEAFGIGRGKKDAILVKVGEADAKNNVWYPVQGRFLDYSGGITTYRRKILRIVVEEVL